METLLSRRTRMSIQSAIFVATAVLVIELLVHLLLEPYETPLYFLAIFLAAAATWLIVGHFPRITAILVGGLIFVLIKVAYYIVAYYVGWAALSCCLVNPIHLMGIHDVVLYQFGYYEVTTSVFLEAFPIHYMVFVAGASIGSLAHR